MWAESSCKCNFYDDNQSFILWKENYNHNESANPRRRALAIRMRYTIIRIMRMRTAN